MPSFLRRIVSLPNTAAASEEVRLEALPSRLSKRFGKEPALGTVVVDENFPGLPDLESKMAQSVFELVEPQVASSSSTPTSSSVENKSAQRPRRVVRQGGLVLFSAAYLQAHPESAAARLAKSYTHTYAHNRVQQKDELSTVPATATVSADADEKEKQEAEKLLAVQREVFSADLGCLPLFRFRSDDDVYGRACYIRRSTSTASSGASSSSPAPVHHSLARTTYSSAASLSDGEESEAEHIVASPTSASAKVGFPEVHVHDASHRPHRVAMTA